VRVLIRVMTEGGSARKALSLAQRIAKVIELKLGWELVRAPTQPYKNRTGKGYRVYMMFEAP